MAYIGRNPAIGTQKVLDSLESQFNGTLTTFDLRYLSNTIYPTIASALIVSLGGVLQEPGEAYTVASDTITFATAPPTGADCWILLYSEFGGVAGATTNLTVGNNLAVQGATDLDGDIDIDAGQITYTASSNIAKFADNAKLIFGEGDDLQIYHTGSISYISDQGVGALRLLASDLRVRNAADTGQLATFTQNGAVTLFHNNSEKFATTTTGATVTGTALATALSTGASGTGINISTNTISGPATLTLDPAAVGDNTGTVVIAGDLQVDGTTTTINSTTLTVDDKNIVLASGSANSAAADGAGITIDGANESLTWVDSTESFKFSTRLAIGSATTKGSNLRLSKDLGGESLTTYYAFLNNGLIQPDVTGTAYYNFVQVKTDGNSGTAYTIGNIHGYVAVVGGSSISADSTITNLTGFNVKSSWTVGTNNYGFRGAIANAANRWNVYMDGTAPNYFAGNVGIGTNNPSGELHIYQPTGQATTLKIEGGSPELWFKDVDETPIFRQITNSNGWNVQPGTGSVTSPTWSSVALIVDGNGNVGIGTSNPTTKLEVVGDITVTNGTQENGIRTNSDGKLQFMRNSVSNNTPAVTINDENGFVGIGTDSPAYLAHIHNPGTGTGDHAYLHFTTGDTGSTGSDGLTVGVGADQTAYINYREAGSLVLSASGTEKVRITSGFGGNLLVGMDTVYDVNAVAHFKRGINIVYEDFGGTDEVASATAAGQSIGRILFSDARPGKYASIECVADGTPGTNDYPGRLVFRTTPDSGSNTVERMRISSDGNVGIGTTNSTNLLHIFDDAVANNKASLKIEAFRPKIRFQDRSTSSSSAEISGDNALIFNISSPVDDATSLTERMRITNAGFVGIGTNNPSSELDIYSSTFSDITISTARTTGNIGGINFRKDVTGTPASMGQVYVTIAGDYIIKSGGTDASDEAIRIEAGGNVGIGTNSPNYKLHVEGDIRAQGGALILSYADAGNIDHLWHDDTSEYGTTGSFVFNSDATYKNSTGGTWSNIKVGHVYVDNGNLGTSAGNTQDLARFYANNGNATSIRLQAKRKVAGTAWTSASMKIFCNTDVTEQGYIEFNPQTTVVGDGNYDVAIGSNNGEIARFTTEGNVGIGTVSTTKKLHVAQESTDTYGTGVAKFTYTDTNGAGNLGSAALHFDAEFKPGHSYFKSFITSNSTDLLIVDQDNSSTRASFAVEGAAGNNKVLYAMSNGNVGIGTATPAYKLEVEGDIKVGELGTLWFSDASNSVEKIVGTGGNLDIYADASVNFFESDTNVRKFTVDVNDGQLDLGSDLGTTTAQVHFDYHATSYINGSLFGLGTTSPAANLQVEYGTGSNAPTTIRIGTANDLNIDRVYSLGWGDPSVTNMGMGPHSTARSVFGSRHGLGIHVNTNDEFSVRSNGWEKLFGVEGGTGRGYFKGNVGIGTVNPQEKLHVEGNMRLNGSVIGGVLTAVVADDSYVDVTPSILGGHFVITPFSTYPNYPQPVGGGMMYYDVGNSRILTTIVDTEVQRTGSTAKLIYGGTGTSTTATDFTDNAITVTTPSGGTLRIFNRAGSDRQFKLVFL